MKKELLLAGSMIMGAGGAVEAQEPTPIVEQAERMNLQPGMDILDIYVNFAAEPQFFQEMQRKANSADANKYFTLESLSGRGGFEMRYNDAGLTEDDRVNKGLTDVFVEHEVTSTVEPISQQDLFATTDSVNLIIGPENTIASGRRMKFITSDAVLFDYFDNTPEGTERQPTVPVKIERGIEFSGREGDVGHDTWFLMSVNDGQIIYQYSKLEFIDRRTGEPFPDDIQDELFAQREEREKSERS